MAPWKHKGLIYSPLPNSETDGDFSMSYSGTEIVNLTLRGSLLRIYILLIHIALFVSSILMAYHDDIWGGMTYSQPSKLQKYEIPWAEDAVEYETVIFAPSGFTEDGRPATPYEGPPSPELDARWHDLSKVGMYSVTAEELNELNLTSAPAPKGPPGEHIVTIEMFHQLHCLNYVRQAAYDHRTSHEGEHSKVIHLAHCLDYLRQVIMCHGDLTPITLEPMPERRPPVMPDFRIRHSCRNFNKIWEFAVERNTSGVGIE